MLDLAYVLFWHIFDLTFIVKWQNETQLLKWIIYGIHENSLFEIKILDQRPTYECSKQEERCWFQCR